MNEPLEIHITPGQPCKVIQGVARRTFYSTEEAIALALLKMGNDTAISVDWIDFLSSKGIAIGARRNVSLTLLVIPAKKRTITWQRGELIRELKVVLPSLLIASKFTTGRLTKTTLWIVKPGFESKLSTSGTDPVLALFPYGNVYGNGAICWGTTPIQDLKNPIEVEDAFFNSGFNGDLYYPRNIGAEEVTLPDLVKRVGEELPMPSTDRYLKSVSNVAQDIAR